MTKHKIVQDLRQENQTPVLIVGGSLVGLSAGLFLSWRGVPAIVVEKHMGSHPHPRAIGFTERTLEFFRAVGLSEQIPQIPSDFKLRRARVESLAGKWFEESAWTPSEAEQETQPASDYSPVMGAAIPQDKLEPLLRTRAQALGLDLRQGTELLKFSQNETGVEALVLERFSGHTYTIQADYLIAADGHKSPIRESLNIPRQGQGYIQTIRSVLFRAPDAEAYLSRGISQFEIAQPDLKAFLTTYQDGRWVLMFTDDQERNEAEQLNAIKKALGRTDIEVEILTQGRWELSGWICEKYRQGRIFLAGDAAHTLPPTRGGFGANTGIDDVHNLAWKLELVLKGQAGPQLLDSYNAERQPIGWLRHQQTFARPDYAKYARTQTNTDKLYCDAGMELGQLLRSAAILEAGPELPPAQRPDLWLGQPGVRAPHAWILHQDQKISTLDLFQKGFVLLSSDLRWQAAVQELKAQWQLDLAFFQVGVELIFLEPERFEDLFGVTETGASLIRPDGVVGWRAIQAPTQPAQSLMAALQQITAHSVI